MANVSIVNDYRGPTPKPRKVINVDPGFFEVPVSAVRERFISNTRGGLVDMPHVWTIRNRKTGFPDCVVGPCTFDEMIETWSTLEGGETPIGQGRWR